ncbi:DUF1349 domain-containing protein [Rufibacter sp. LB8]|uniref:DUF1349 domain-containing protein n=1 Tax=Rufibacter sp. LB8 TaxID=2777781 RepID=UPI00178C1F68|nr:DUF1349 domain-containing protein [Rufibacter sp. LB8]
MTTTRLKLLLLLLMVCFIPETSLGQTPATFQVKAIPFVCQVLDKPSEVKVLSENSVLLTAEGNTDLHNPASAAFQKSNAPKFLFTPDQNFDFSAKVAPSHDNLYDGGALLIWTDTGNWAKVLLQNTGSGSVLGLSVVENSRTDDSYFSVGAAREIYLRILKKGNVGTFYMSTDGTSWTVLRQFVYHRPDQMHVGFYVQSPKGPSCQTLFSEIRYNKIQP